MEDRNAPEHAVAPEHPSNRRRHSRYLCEGQAEVYLPHGGLLLRGRILNLSLSGCFIEAPALNLERGTHVEVYFTARGFQFRISGRIAVRHRRRGAGIAFHDLGPRRARYITDLIHELEETAAKARNPASEGLSV